jgi:hypothetical protein
MQIARDVITTYDDKLTTNTNKATDIRVEHMSKNREEFTVSHIKIKGYTSHTFCE